MKISIEIANRTKKRIKADFAKGIIRKTVKLSAVKLSDFLVSVVFLEKGGIKKINQKYRRKNKPTDVLSFIYTSRYNKGGKTLEGELVLCPEIIISQAEKNKVTFQKELAFVLSHGVLHLLGFRHGKKMFGMQNIVSEKCKSQNLKMTIQSKKCFEY
jgi:rRNA maturation RNase YbeY